MPNQSYPRYLNNKPIGEDQFEGRSHERIATSISDHIKRHDNTLKVLGLEGEWGSGKSNVIEVLRKKLEKTHHIYIYDAWGHQEDSQRRAFLEELTEDLLDNGLLTKKTNFRDLSGRERKITWQEKLNYLLSRKRKTNKRSVPKLSAGIILTGLVVVLTPILALISDLIGSETGAILLKILFSTSLILLGIICWVLYALYEKFLSSKKSWPTLSSLFTFYKGKVLENTTSEIFSDLEPSVKEFKSWIKSISSGLVKKELVIVYDNMDRLPPEKVKSIWSSIHTFFAEEDYEKINVIIPFDKVHIQQVFVSEKGSTTCEFINKTFSIIYRVTPPVLTDWKNFFTKKFEEAFAKDEEEELLTVLSLFDRLKKKFTPRDIIVFINELVTLKRIWKDDIPLRYIGVYVLRKDKILESPQERILSSDYLGTTKDIFIEDTKLQNFISALTFNVPVERASQVLLVRDLEVLLQGNVDNSPEINKMAQHQHFIEILEEVINNSEIVLEESIPILYQLEDSKIKGERVEERIEKLWNILSSKQCSKKISELSFTDNFKFLLEKSSSSNKEQLLNYLTASFNSFEEISGEDYFHSFSEMEAFIVSNDIKFNLSKRIKPKEVPPQNFIDYLVVAKDNYEKFKLKTDPQALDDYVAEVITDQWQKIPTAFDFSIIRDKYKFDNTSETIGALFEQNKLTKENFPAIIRVYKSIFQEKPLPKKLSYQNLYNLLQSVGKDDPGYYDLIAMRLSMGISYNQEIQRHGWSDITTQELSSNDAASIEKTSQEIEYYITYGELLLLLLSWRKPLLKGVCEFLTKNRVGYSKMVITVVLEKFEQVKTALDVTSEELLKRLEGWSSSAEEEIGTENLQEIIPSVSFFDHSTELSLKLTNHINKIAEEWLCSRDEDFLIEEWGDENSYSYSALMIFMSKGKITELPRNFFSAIKKVLKQICEGEIVIPEGETKWSFFVDRCRKTEIKPTVKDIRDYYIQHGNITNQEFLFYEEFFRRFGDLHEKPSDVVRTILGKVVTTNNCFELIIKESRYYLNIIKEAGDDAADFLENIQTRVDNSPEQEDLIDFAEELGITAAVEEEVKNNENRE